MPMGFLGDDISAQRSLLNEKTLSPATMGARLGASVPGHPALKGPAHIKRLSRTTVFPSPEGLTENIVTP